MTLRRLLGTLVSVRHAVALLLFAWGLVAPHLPIGGAAQTASAVVGYLGLLLADLNRGIAVVGTLLHARSTGIGQLHLVSHILLRAGGAPFPAPWGVRNAQASSGAQQHSSGGTHKAA